LIPRLVLVSALSVVAPSLGLASHAHAGNGSIGIDGSASAANRSELRREHWADGVAMAAAGYGPVGGDAQLAREVLAEMNLIRSDPQAYIAILQDYRRQFQGTVVVRPGRINIQTREGATAVDEAIAFLRRQKPVSPLSPDVILAQTAADHVADQGPTGFIGHYGSDGWDFATRVSRRGGDPYGGENISYGYDTAREVMIQLLVDDNIADRGHRMNLFRDGFVRAGVSCGPHAVFNHMCVIDYGYEPVKRR